MQLRYALFTVVIGAALAAACDKEKQEGSNAPSDGDDKSGNLCTEYKTCDECIAGQQAKGKTEGAAETECGAAVMGCWTTWDKPIVCNGKEQKEGQ